jgi:acetylornithine deacetylase/succinyl-diaminopimelate desuccinylase-like protein
VDKFLGKPSLNVGLIVGGDNACSVPDICKIDIDRRIISSENYETFINELEKICHGIQKEIPDFRYSISSPFLNIKPLDTPLNSPIMIAMKKASDDTLGFHTIKAFPGSTDAPNFNCEAVICGPGSLRQCHSLNEYVDIEEIKNAVNIYISSIINLQNNMIL